jgi:hypothetical protein
VKSLRNGMVYIPTPENGIKAQRLLSCAIEMAIAHEVFAKPVEQIYFFQNKTSFCLLFYRF